jgi:ABC-type antimicrobial peptide transport system permease subunit
LSFLSTFLLIFALVAVFVSTFLIFNTFSMVVAQRTREIALLRAIGASRDQIQRSVVLEALIVALVASTVGLALGIGLALGLRFLFARFGIELPSGAFEVAPRTIVAAYTVGIVVTIAAAWIPAIRASSVPPLAALRAETAPARASLVRRLWFGLAGLVFAVLFAFLGLSNGSETGVAWIGVSAVFGIGGTFALTPFLAGPALSLLGLPFRGAVGRLAVQNSRRSPRRTAATASALMIGQGRAAVDSDLADSKGRNVGDTVEVTWRTGQSEVEIVATFQKVLVFEGFLTDYETVQRWGAPPGQDTAVYLKLAEGADPDAVRSSVEEVLVKYPTVSVLDQAQIKADIQAQIDQLLRFVFALLGLAIIIAVLGIVNTLLLSVAERTGELGLLRAIGATPQVLRRDWRHHLHLDVGSTRSIRHPSHPNHCARSHLRPRRDLRQDLLFANRGQLRRRNTDDQDLQGECLTLLTNAVVCWNTVYIAAAIDHLRQTGLVITEEQIRHLSPAGREHINRYDFYTPSLPDHGQLRPLRTCSVGSCPFTAGTPLGVVVFHATSGIPACDRHRSPMSFSTMRRTVLTPNSRISALSAL